MSRGREWWGEPVGGVKTRQWRTKQVGADAAWQSMCAADGVRAGISTPRTSWFLCVRVPV